MDPRLPAYGSTQYGFNLHRRLDDLFRLIFRQARERADSSRHAEVLTADANYTVDDSNATARIIDVTSSVSLTATRDLVLPMNQREWIVYNGTTGGQSLQVIGASGTGVTIANAKRAIVYCDGTNFVRATADV